MSDPVSRHHALGDFLEVKHGFAFKSTFFGSSGDYIVLTPGNFLEKGGFKDKGTDEKWYSGPVPPEYVLRNGDVVVAMTEQGEGLLGSSAIIPREDLYLHNQRIGLLRFKDAELSDPRFFYYLFNCRWVRRQIRASATGAKIRHTAPGRIAEVSVWVPDPREQRQIADILSAYDDLIENNLRRIQILEEMARAIYREWFVHFRFPGHERVKLVDSRLGLIPEGWKITSLGEIAEQVRRNVPSGELATPTPYVGLEHIPRCSLALDAWDTVTKLRSNKLAFRQGEILFGKIRPYFHKVIVAPFDGLCSADTIVLRAFKQEHYGLTVAIVSSDEFVAHASATANGAKMPRASWPVLANYPVTVPSMSLARNFSDKVTDLLQLQQLLLRQITNLRATRDLLLPRLMSGQLTLPEAEGAASVL